VHLLAVCDQQAAAVLGQAGVDGKTSEVTRFAPLPEPLDLTGCVITADAMHTQRDHAEFLVSGKNAHYILIVQKNQPGLYAQIKNLPWRQVRPGARQRGRGMDPRSLAHRSPAPHPRRDLRRRSQPGPHRQQLQGYGNPCAIWPSES
jgi:Transposase DDE domain